MVLGGFVHMGKVKKMQSKRAIIFVDADTGKIHSKYESAGVASKVFNVTKNQIYGSCLNRNNQIYGQNYYARFADDKDYFIKKVNYSKLCVICGTNFESKHPSTKYCNKCRIEVRKEQKKKSIERKKQILVGCNYPVRDLTADTEKLICIYNFRGDSVDRISEDLMRNRNQVEMILDEAKKSGRYDNYVNAYKSRMKCY